MTDTVSVMSGRAVATWIGSGIAIGAGATYEPATRNSWQNGQCAGSSGSAGELRSRLCERATSLPFTLSVTASAPTPGLDSDVRWICVCVTKLERKKLRSANTAIQARIERRGDEMPATLARPLCPLACRNDVGLASFANRFTHDFGLDCNKRAILIGAAFRFRLQGRTSFKTNRSSRIWCALRMRYGTPFPRRLEKATSAVNFTQRTSRSKLERMSASHPKRSFEAWRSAG